jgi:hypothetical protein
MDEAEMRELVRQKLAQLGEHCDCAIILVTWRNNGETLYIDEHSGNEFTREALLKTYVAEQSPEPEDEFRDEWEKDED